MTTAQIPAENLLYRDQDLDDLRLCLFDQSLPHDSFQVLAESRAATAAGLSAVFRVLGASHSVCVEYGGDLLQEVLACVPLDDLPLEPLASGEVTGGLDDGDPVEYRVDTGRFHYFFYARHQRLSPLLQHRAQALAGKADALFVNFPGPFVCSPFTLVAWQMSQRSCKIDTVHAYPADITALVSCSTFSLDPVHSVRPRLVMDIDTGVWDADETEEREDTMPRSARDLRVPAEEY